ncbi:MAG TPA: hypothetical protein IAA15_06165 [Candidatus Olsenella pullicola]|nr:hypothetical protein [Candidatus Olsenella pullicola]
MLSSERTQRIGGGLRREVEPEPDGAHLEPHDGRPLVGGDLEYLDLVEVGRLLACLPAGFSPILPIISGPCRVTP